jgi:hypothetical protein
MDLKDLKSSLKEEIEKEKDKLLNSCEREGIKFFLDSIKEDIREMVNLGFNYRQQLDIINRSSEKEIKYNTYLRYIKTHFKKGKISLNSSPIAEVDRRRVGFTHEAVPDPEELY